MVKRVGRLTGGVGSISERVNQARGAFPPATSIHSYKSRCFFRNSDGDEQLKPDLNTVPWDEVIMMAFLMAEVDQLDLTESNAWIKDVVRAAKNENLLENLKGTELQSRVVDAALA